MPVNWSLGQHKLCVADRQFLGQSLNELKLQVETYLKILDEHITKLREFDARLTTLENQHKNFDDDLGKIEFRLLERIEALEEREVSTGASSTEEETAAAGFTPFSQRKAQRQKKLSNPSALIDKIQGKS